LFDPDPEIEQAVLRGRLGPADLDQASASGLVESQRGMQVAVAGQVALHGVYLGPVDLNVRRASSLRLVDRRFDLDLEHSPWLEVRDPIRQLTSEPAPRPRRCPIHIKPC
jgi:hypothetical protein